MLISNHLPKIVDLIKKHPVVSVVASTGSGKSVGIPASVAAMGSRCFAVVPTRTAAISLAEYQRSIQHGINPTINMEEYVGYAAEGNVKYTANTTIAYITGGHARRKMLSYFSKGTARDIDFCDVLMVDEVHSGSLDTTVIISLWMKAAALGVNVPRLVIASATPVPMEIHPKPELYTVDFTTFPIEYRYLNKDLDIDSPNKILYTDSAKLAADIHRDTPVDSGHILIFAPGSADVETIASKLKDLLKMPAQDKKVDIIPAFGALSQDDIALIYKQATANERKIVIATNIAEMSITIENIGHVIDTMVEKRAETSQSGGFRLTTRHISKDSAKQRAGRTGRTRPGVCYRMITEESYNKLEDHRPPEIQRIPIYDVIMELLDRGLAPADVIKEVDNKRIATATQLLKHLGMVIDTPNGIAVTEMGHFAPRFHISVRNSAFLWKWIQEKLPIFPGVVIACLIDSYGPSYFWIPRRKDMPIEEYNLMVQEHKKKYFSKYIGYNDLESSINMWRDLMATIGDLDRVNKANNWARENSINAKKIKELIKVVKQSVMTVINLGYEIKLGPFTTEGAMGKAKPLLLSAYSDMTLIHSKGTTYFNPISKEDYRLDTRDAVNKMSADPPIGVIALVTAEIKTQHGSFRIVGFGVDTDKDGLGRPIVAKNRPLATRGQGVIARGTQGITPIGQPDVSNALNLLATLNIGKEVAKKEPAQKYVHTNMDDALNLLASLDNPLGEEEIPLNVENVVCEDKIFTLIQDHDLPAGTKQRGIEFFRKIKAEGYTEIVTYGTPYGYGQVATAWCCRRAGLLCTVVAESVNPHTDMTNQAIINGANFIEVPPGSRNEVKKNRALEYVKESPLRKFVELGLDDPDFIKELAIAIAKVNNFVEPKRIWVAGGSVVLSRALAKAFPNVELQIVQVGRDIWPELLEGVKHKLYVTKQPFPQAAKLLPRYPSLVNYDAKVWEFACQYGQTGDYIWNVK